MRRAVAILGVSTLLCCAGAGALLGWSLRAPSSEPREVVFEVPPGATLSLVARELADAGVIRSAPSFELLARFRGRAGGLRAGEYALSPSLSADEVLTRLALGAVITHRVVLPEGLSAREVAARLDAAGLATASEFLAVALDPALPAVFGVDAATLEGYLFPETYELAKGLSPREIVRLMVEQFLRVWRPLAPLARDSGLTMRQVVVLASLVEKETGAHEERPLVAAVFLNRLARGMRLETDPAVIYGIADFDGNLRRVHLEDEGNPYNTYLFAGLPPGPIANPGEASLRAVVQPADADYLFFVARRDGTHQFSRSYAEHVRAVDRYQRNGGAGR
ncbi:MAG: endolytic transglycosylase MltG [Myxococcota bacterium]